MAKMERGLKQKYLKYQRKILVGLGIALSPAVLSMIGYYCNEYYSFHNININNQNYLIFFLMMGFVVIISLANLVNAIYSRKLANDTHNIVQILVEMYLEDTEKFKQHGEKILNYFDKYGGK